MIDADHQIDFLEQNVDEMAVSLLARQAPVAGDLRTVVSAMRLAATLERMGDLARRGLRHGRFPQTAAEGTTYELLISMADEAATVGKMVAELVESQDLSLARQIEENDEVLDTFHRVPRVQSVCTGHRADRDLQFNIVRDFPSTSWFHCLHSSCQDKDRKVKSMNDLFRMYVLDIENRDIATITPPVTDAESESLLDKIYNPDAELKKILAETGPLPEGKAYQARNLNAGLLSTSP